MDDHNAHGSRRLARYPPAAEFLGVKPSTLYAWVSQRRIPHIRLGPRMVLFDLDELQRWLDARRIPGVEK